ncbi:hypothetical protein IWW54_003250, partial [Coemansia sp. RSA 2705]
MATNDNASMAPVPQAAGNPPNDEHYMPAAYPADNARTNQTPMVLFDSEHEQLKGGGFCGACWGCIAA